MSGDTMKMKMGTHFKKSIFDDHIQAGLVGWAQKARKRKKMMKTAANTPDQESKSSAGPSTGIQLVEKQSNQEEIQASNETKPSNEIEPSNEIDEPSNEIEPSNSADASDNV